MPTKLTPFPIQPICRSALLLGVPRATVITPASTEIFCKAWGSVQPAVFSHGWPLNADAWEPQLFFMASNGFRAIAHRRSWRTPS